MNKLLTNKQTKGVLMVIRKLILMVGAIALLMGSSYRLVAQEQPQKEQVPVLHTEPGHLLPSDLNSARRSWTVTYDLSAQVNVASDPSRLHHAPALIKAPNGDWLLAFQYSRGTTRFLDHVGADALIGQVRSRDEGKTWEPETIAYDGRQSGCLARNPAYGVSAEGVIVLVAQCSHLFDMSKQVIGRDEGIDGSVYLISHDNGKTYEYRGLVDPVVPLRHQGTTAQIILVGKTLFMPAISIGVKPYGITLYTTDDPTKGWTYVGWIFRTDQMPVPTLTYPRIIQRRDGWLLAQAVDSGYEHGSGGSRNFQSISADNGKTWSPPRELTDMTLGWHISLDYAGDVLVASGRADDRLSVGAYFSPDDGETWDCPIILDRYGFRGWGGYAASLRTKTGDVFIAFSTDSHTEPDERPTIRGVFLRNVKVRYSSGQWPFE